MSSDATATETVRGGAVLAGLTFIYCWVTLTPFKDLGPAMSRVSEDAGSNTLNQIVAALLFGSALLIGTQARFRDMLLKPRWLLVALFGWLVVVSVLGGDPSFSLRRVVLALLIAIGANVFLLLPRSEEQFARILTVCSFIVLGLCYGGVLLLPRLAIHQGTDFLEPMLAGDWRGMFDHKNGAAPAMVILIFIGLFIATRRSRLAGYAIVVLAAVFLWNAGGKTALGMFPLVIIAAWLLERVGRFLRPLIVIATAGGYSLLTLGTVIWEPVRQLVVQFGVDDTFTGRTDIWPIALAGIKAEPLFGYGYDRFWGTENLVYGFREEATWAVTAPSAHNSYLDIALVGGWIGLAMALVWLVVLPTRDLSLAIERGGRSALTRLYTRIWVFCLLIGSMESFFLATNGGVWFTMMVAVFGLRLQAQAQKRSAYPEKANRSAGFSPGPVTA